MLWGATTACEQSGAHCSTWDPQNPHPLIAEGN